MEGKKKIVLNFVATVKRNKSEIPKAQREIMYQFVSMIHHGDEPSFVKIFNENESFFNSYGIIKREIFDICRKKTSIKRFIDEYEFSTTKFDYLFDYLTEEKSKCVKDLVDMLSGYQLKRSIEIMELEWHFFLWNYWIQKDKSQFWYIAISYNKFSKFVMNTIFLGRLPVVQAIFSRSPKKISEFKELFHDMTFKDCDGNTPLHIACQGNFEEEALILMEGIEGLKEHGGLAAVSGQTKLLKLSSGRTCLLSLEPNDKGNTPLHLACSHRGQVHLAETLVTWKNSLILTKNKDNKYPFQIAHDCDLHEYFVMLLLNNCTLNYVSHNLQMAQLSHSCASQNSIIEDYIQTAKILVQKYDFSTLNISPFLYDLVINYVLKDKQSLQHSKTLFDNFVTGYFKTSWHCKFPSCISDDQMNIIIQTYLKEHEDQSSSVFGYITSSMNLQDIYEMLHASLDHVTFIYWINKGFVLNCRYTFDINARTTAGKTLFEEAYSAGHYVACAWLMVRKHCSVYLNAFHTNTEECKALQQICEKTLLNFPADSAIKSVIPGDTLLHVAASMSNATELIQFLIVEMKFDVNILNSRQENPLHIACRTDHASGVYKLFQNCDFQLRNIDGDTPLNLLFYYHYSEHALDIASTLYQDIQTMIEDINIESWSEHCEKYIYLARNSPLHIAIKVKSNVEKLKTNVSNACFGKWCHWKNTLGELPLHIAACNRDLNNLKLVMDAKNYNCVTNRGNSAVHELCVHSNNSDEDLEILKFLHEDLHCNTHVANRDGQTALHITCRRGCLKLAEYLLKIAKLDPNAKDNNNFVPLMLTPLGQSEIVRTLIQYGADTSSLYATYKTFFENYSSEKPPPTPLNVIVIGNHSSGKSTLIKAMKEENSTIQIIQAEPHTAGIIPSFYQSQNFGTIMWYDLAGHSEYYASHEAVLNTVMTSSTPMVLLLVDVRKPQEIINQEVLYWLHFLQCLRKMREFSIKPHIVVVFSFQDKVKASTQGKIDVTKKVLAPFFVKLKCEIKAFIELDCRDPRSDNIRHLQSLVKESYLSLCDKTQLNFLLHCFYAFLVGNFNSEAAVTVQRVLQLTQEWIDTGIDPHYQDDEEVDSDESLESYDPENDLEFEQECPAKLLPKYHKHTFDMCKKLSSKGHVILIEDSLRTAECSWIIINKDILLKEINGSLFAPENFKLHYKDISSSTGVVTLSKLSEVFPTYNIDLLSRFLVYLEFCNEISDKDVLELLCLDTESSSNRYFFFPGLVSIDKPEYVWKNTSSNKCGWILQVTEFNAFFTPRFIQILLLRLTFSYPLSTKKRNTGFPNLTITRRCSVWKTGLFWQTELGLDCLIEIRENSQAIVMMLSSEEELSEKHMILFIKYRSSLISKILATVDELCSFLFVEEFFLHPDYVMYPPIKCEDAALYSIRSIARAVCEQLPFVPCTSTKHNKMKLTDILIFEPFILSDYCHLLSKSLHNETISHEDFQQCTSQVCSVSPTLDSLCKELKNSKKCTYGDLRKLLGEYSIFGERDPQVLGSCNVNILHPKSLRPMNKSSTFEGKPTLPMLISFKCRDGKKVNILEKIGTKYFNFGILLLNDEDGSKMSTIVHDKQRISNSIISEILTLWFQGKGKPVSWKVLVKVLEDIELSRLAEEIHATLHQ